MVPPNGMIAITEAHTGPLDMGDLWVPRVAMGLLAVVAMWLGSSPVAGIRCIHPPGFVHEGSTNFIIEIIPASHRAPVFPHPSCFGLPLHRQNFVAYDCDEMRFRLG